MFSLLDQIMTTVTDSLRSSIVSAAVLMPSLLPSALHFVLSHELLASRAEALDEVSMESKNFSLSS